VSVAICALLAEMSSRKRGHGYSRACSPTHCRCLRRTAVSASPPPLPPPPPRCLPHLRCIAPLPLLPSAAATSPTWRLLPVPPKPPPTAAVTPAASVAAPRCLQERQWPFCHGEEAAGFREVGTMAAVAAATAAAMRGTVATVCDCREGRGEERQDQKKEGARETTERVMEERDLSE